MLFFSRILPAIAIAFSCQLAVQAQGIKVSIPSENALNRQGLTLAWWAQASINPARDTVQFLTADEQNVFVQSTSGVVSSFHGELGRKLWTQLIGRPDQQSYPATSSDQEVLITIGLHLFALNKDNGRRAWELTMPEYPATSPTIDGKYIFAGTVKGGVFAFDEEKVRDLYQRGMLPTWTTRAELWNFQATDQIVSPPISLGNNVIFASEKGTVYSVSRLNKELKYQLETGNIIRAPIGYSKDRVFVADRNARMLCINTNSGQVTWTFSGGSPIIQQPRAVGGHVFIAPHREGLTCLSLTSGALQWQQKLAHAFVAASETRVYAVDANGELLILDRKTGSLTGTLNLRDFPVYVSNDRTDRIFLGTTTGTLLSLREIGSTYPVYHLYPERRPLLPEFAPEEPAEENANGTAEQQ